MVLGFCTDEFASDHNARVKVNLKALNSLRLEWAKAYRFANFLLGGSDMRSPDRWPDPRERPAVHQVTAVPANFGNWFPSFGIGHVASRPKPRLTVMLGQKRSATTFRAMPCSRYALAAASTRAKPPVESTTRSITSAASRSKPLLTTLTYVPSSARSSNVHSTRVGVSESTSHSM